MARKERPPESLTEPMLKWEDVMSELAGKWTDSLLVLDHIQQMLEEAPWLASRHAIAVEYQKGVRDGIEETMRRAFVFWNGNFWERLQAMGFDDPEP